jgi:hypothetical protein
LAADGSELWHVYHQAFFSPPCNQRDGALLLDPFSSLDAAYVVASSLHDVVVDPDNGDIYATGEVRLAWLESGGPVWARGAIVAQWGADGTLIRDAYWGPVPAGAPPPPVGCHMFCTLGNGDRGADDAGEYGGRGLVLVGTDVLVTGWYREFQGADRDFFVARLAGDPWLPLWMTEAGTTGEDEGRDLAVGPLGDIFMTGFGGSDRDALLAKLLPGGKLESWIFLRGPEDDEGHSIEIDANGRLLLGGIFSQKLTIGDQTLGTEEDEAQGWSGLFATDLSPISAQVVDVDGIGQRENPHEGTSAGAPPKDLQDLESPAEEVDHHEIFPLAYEVVVGTKGRGGLRELSTSDDHYMRIVADEDQYLELKVWMQPYAPADSNSMPLFLKEIRVEVKSQFCYTATLRVNGILGPEFLVAGQRSICPSDEPILSVPITPELSALLGFDGEIPMLPDHRLTVALSIQFHNTPDLPAGAFGQTAEQDSSVDQISADVEY